MSRQAGPKVKLLKHVRECLVVSRERAGLTQEALGERLSVTGKHIYEVENGRKDPSQSLLEQWCESLGLSCEVRFPPPVVRLWRMAEKS